MKTNELKNWIVELKEKVPKFLAKMEGNNVKGYYRYAYSGDIYNENEGWGLGNTVFATKIYSSLNLLENLPENKKESLAQFILSFEKKDGSIYDPLIKRKARLNNIKEALKTRDFNNLFSKQTITAETRQAISVLKLLGKKKTIEYSIIPKNKNEIERYLKKLDWTKPWGAGSHFSHLIFFLKNSNIKDKENLIDYAIKWVNHLQKPSDGAWYLKNPSSQQKINGAMKVITAMKVANKMKFKYAKKLIDLSLNNINNEHACNNFNIIYVLKYANEMTRGNYRSNEIKEFALNRLDLYRKFYYPKIGGFSFLPNKTNQRYYGAKITRGLDEPDIHGTVMFIWGISIITQILKIDKKLKLEEVIP